MNNKAFGNLTISVLLVPIRVATPPSASTQNFLCSSRLVTLRWWCPWRIGPSLAARSCAEAFDDSVNASNARTARENVRLVLFIGILINPKDYIATIDSGDRRVSAGFSRCLHADGE